MATNINPMYIKKTRQHRPGGNKNPLYHLAGLILSEDKFPNNRSNSVIIIA